jgi:hypothetical protein
VVKISPWLSPATHTAALGHATDLKAIPCSKGAFSTVKGADQPSAGPCAARAVPDATQVTDQAASKAAAATSRNVRLEYR